MTILFILFSSFFLLIDTLLHTTPAMFRSLSWTPRIIHSFKAPSVISSTTPSPLFTSFSFSSTTSSHLLNSSSLSSTSFSSHSSFSTLARLVSLPTTKAHQHHRSNVLATLTRPFSTTSNPAMRIIPVPVLEGKTCFFCVFFPVGRRSHWRHSYKEKLTWLLTHAFARRGRQTNDMNSVGFGQLRMTAV